MLGNEEQTDVINELFHEVKKIYPHLEFLRRKNEQIEFGIMNYDQEIHWFPYYRLPEKAEKYINSWLKLKR